MTLESVGPGGVGFNYGTREAVASTQANAFTPRTSYDEFKGKGGRTVTGFKDLTSSVSTAGVPAALAPVRSSFWSRWVI